MNIAQKRDYLDQHLLGIATHDDVDAAVRLATLDAVVVRVGQLKADIQARIDAEIAATLGGEG